MAKKPTNGTLKPPQVDKPPVGNYHSLGYYSRDQASQWVTCDSDPPCFLGKTTGDLYINASDHLQLESKVYRHNVEGAVTQFFGEVDRKVENNETVYIKGSNTIHCNANRTVDIVGSHALSTAASQTTDIAAGQEITVKGGRTLDVAGNLTETITGNHKVTIKGDDIETVNGQRVETSNRTWESKDLGPYVVLKASTENLFVASAKTGLSFSLEESITIGLAEKAALSAETVIATGTKDIKNFACKAAQVFGPKYEYDLKRITESKSMAKAKVVKDSVKALMEKIKSSLKKTDHSKLEMG